MPHYAQIEPGRGSNRVHGVVFYGTEPPDAAVLAKLNAEGRALASITEEFSHQLEREAKKYRGRRVPPSDGRERWELELRPPDDPTPDQER